MTAKIRPLGLIGCLITKQTSKQTSKRGLFISKSGWAAVSLDRVAGTHIDYTDHNEVGFTDARYRKRKTKDVDEKSI